MHEVRLPGVGMRYEIELGDGARLVIVAQRTGRRELGLSRGGDSLEWNVALGQEEAVMLASLLLGARFTLDTSDDDRLASDEVVVDTVELRAGSPAIGHAAAEITLPDPDAAVLAVISDSTPEVLEDEVSYRSRPGDRVIVAARAAQIDRVVEHLRGRGA